MWAIRLMYGDNRRMRSRNRRGFSTRRISPVEVQPVLEEAMTQWTRSLHYHQQRQRYQEDSIMMLETTTPPQQRRFLEGRQQGQNYSHVQLEFPLLEDVLPSAISRSTEDADRRFQGDYMQ